MGLFFRWIGRPAAFTTPGQYAIVLSIEISAHGCSVRSSRLYDSGWDLVVQPDSETSGDDTASLRHNKQIKRPCPHDRFKIRIQLRSPSYTGLHFLESFVPNHHLHYVSTLLQSEQGLRIHETIDCTAPCPDGVASLPPSREEYRLLAYDFL